MLQSQNVSCPLCSSSSLAKVISVMLSCYNKAVRYLKLHQFSLLSRDVVSCKFLSQLKVRRCYICQGAGSYFNIRSIEVIIANSVIRGWNNTFCWALSQIAAASAGRPKRTRASGNSWEQLLLGGRRPRRPHNSQLLLRASTTL